MSQMQVEVTHSDITIKLNNVVPHFSKFSLALIEQDALTILMSKNNWIDSKQTIPNKSLLLVLFRICISNSLLLYMPLLVLDFGFQLVLLEVCLVSNVLFPKGSVARHLLSIKLSFYLIVHIMVY